jgi:DNA-binding transcriptional MerR regulator
MNDDNCPLIPTCYRVTSSFIDLDSASQLSGMHPEMILEFTRAELVAIAHIDRGGNPYFDDEAIFRLRQIEHLRSSQRTHLRTIRLILHLTDRVESAERELRGLRDRFR